MQKINVIRKWIILEFKTTFFINSSCSFIDESYSDSIDPAGDRKSKLLRPVSRDWPVIRRNYIVAGSSRGGCYETHPFPTVTDINLQYFVESIILRNCSSIFFSRIRSRRDIHTKLQVCPWNLCIPLEPLTRKQYWQLTGEFLTNAFKCIFLPLSNIFKKVV